MSGAPHDLDELKIFLWNRFGELRDTIADPGSLTIQAELPRSAGIDAALDSNLMPLSSSDDLESFVEQTYQERGVCARITIEVPQEEKKSSKYQRGSKKMNIFSQGGIRNSAKRDSTQKDESEQQPFEEANDALSSHQIARDERMSWGLQFYEQ